MAACEANKAVVFDYLSEPGLRRIICHTFLHRTEVLCFNCGLSVAKYQHWLLAMKNNNIGISLKKALLIELYLKSINQT